MSNWALLILIKNSWIVNGTLTLNSNPIPIISLVLLVLSFTLAVEIVYTIIRNRKQHSQLRKEAIG
jgi:hypothetical protein